MTTPFNITVSLTTEDVRVAIAEYVQKNLGQEFSVKAGKVIFEITEVGSDQLCGGCPVHKLTKVTAEATKI